MRLPSICGSRKGWAGGRATCRTLKADADSAFEYAASARARRVDMGSVYHARVAHQGSIQGKDPTKIEHGAALRDIRNRDRYRGFLMVSLRFRRAVMKATQTHACFRIATLVIAG